MIYTPAHFGVGDARIVRDIIRRYNFATMISIRDTTPVISHLPFLFDAGRGLNGTLTAHMARANPHWRAFRDAEVTVIFNGPHAYVSPRWYAPQPNNVPTWNYAVVHAHGVPRVIAEEAAAYDVMGRLVQQHDPEWPLSLSDDDRHDRLRSIVVFEIDVTKIEAKFKLSQNRPASDQKSVADQLSRGVTENDRETGALMRQLFNPRAGS